MQEKQFQSALPLSSVMKFFENNYMKNRTFVTPDIASIFDDIESCMELPVLRRKYKTGEEYSTWQIPPQWSVKKAWLKDSKGKVIGSYDEHPLFVCIYSAGVHTKITKKELKKHVFFEPRRPEAYAYNWRYSSDYNLRLKDWGISIPMNRFEQLSDTETYEVFIDVEVKNGELITGEVTLPGESKETIALLADWCHPGQVNDSFSGLGLFMMVMKTLSRMPNRKYTYKFLMFGETLGSAAYITAHPEIVKTFKGTIFSEMVGWGENWYIKKTREENTYMDEIAKNVAMSFKDINLSPFLGVYGNDELMFNCVGTNIPSLSVQKFPFVEYHTSDDRPEKVNPEDMQKAFNLTMQMVHILETDGVYKQNNPVPFWMTRYKLYSDAIREYDDYKYKFKIVYEYMDGKTSILELANKVDKPYDQVLAFVNSMKENNLVSLVDKASH
jgi:aminopeptidase-like protein